MHGTPPSPEDSVWSQPAQVAGTTRDQIAALAAVRRDKLGDYATRQVPAPAPSLGPVVRMRCLITVVPGENEWGDLAPLSVGDAPWLLYYVDGRYYEIEGS